MFAALTTGDLAWRIFTNVVAVALLVWFFWSWLRKSEDDPGRLISKWVLSAVLLLMGLAVGSTYSPYIGVPAAALCFLIIGILWGPNVGSWMASFLTPLYDGGNRAPDPEPLYSVAQARIKQQRYAEAIAEVQTQLRAFPHDFKGQMMLAEIYADHLKDMDSMREIVERILQDPKTRPQNLVFILNRLADWHLRIARSPEDARAALEQIIQRAPDTEAAHMAEQRIAHLATAEVLEEQRNPHRLTVTPQTEYLGLRTDFTGLKPVDDTPAMEAQALVKQLELHPNDFEAREKLAGIYATHYGRVDLAADQLNQLIHSPHQPAKQVVHWLNQLADIYIKQASDPVKAQETLQQIIARYPKTAAAENALNRFHRVGLEMRSQKKSQAMKLGSYEQNIGLRGAD